MKSAKLIFLLLSLIAVPSIASQPRQNIEKRIDALLAQMTLEEKLGQLQQLDGHADGNFRPEHVELARKGSARLDAQRARREERERASARGG